MKYTGKSNEMMFNIGRFSNLFNSNRSDSHWFSKSGSCDFSIETIAESILFILYLDGIFILDYMRTLNDEQRFFVVI